MNNTQWEPPGTKPASRARGPPGPETPPSRVCALDSWKRFFLGFRVKPRPVGGRYRATFMLLCVAGCRAFMGHLQHHSESRSCVAVQAMPHSRKHGSSSEDKICIRFGVCSMSFRLLSNQLAHVAVVVDKRLHNQRSLQRGAETSKHIPRKALASECAAKQGIGLLSTK